MNTLNLPRDTHGYVLEAGGKSANPADRLPTSHWVIIASRKRFGFDRRPLVVASSVPVRGAEGQLLFVRPGAVGGGLLDGHLVLRWNEAGVWYLITVHLGYPYATAPYPRNPHSPLLRRELVAVAVGMKSYRPTS